MAGQASDNTLMAMRVTTSSWVNRRSTVTVYIVNPCVTRENSVF